jgi:Ca2+-binding EF-hand superfamily protein
MIGVGALASSAMDLLQSLTAKKTSSSASSKGTSGVQSEPFLAALRTTDGSSASTTATKGTLFTNLSATTMSSLLDAQSQTQFSANSKTRSDALKSLFAQLDGDGNGSISKAEFADKLGAGGTNVANADKVFAKLDTDGDGSVNISELGKALKAGSKPQHGGGGDSDTAGSTTSTTANADGSTTTSISYADGSKVTSTSAVPTSSASAAARTSYNAVEQMIARQAQLISSSTSPLSISV